MKRALAVVAIVVAGVLLLVIVGVIGTNAAWRRAGRMAWPSELGTLEDFASQFPKRAPNAGASRLAELAKPIGIDFGRGAQGEPEQEQIAEFVKAEQSRANVGEPPHPVVSYLTQHATQLDAIRDHLLRGGEIVWEIDLDRGFDAPIPNLLAHLQLARVLVARAYVSQSWDDLHAAAMLDKSLRARPDLISQLIALATARMVNAAAWKLPLPAPSWLAEYSAEDHRRPLFRGLQFDTWTLWRHAPGQLKGPFGVLTREYTRASATNLALHQRETASMLSRVTTCGFDGKSFSESRQRDLPRWNIVGQVALPNLGSLWTRVQRHIVEREATANALRVRAGQPIEARSRCSDGSWRYENGELSFSIDIPKTSELDMPLRLQVVADDAAARDHDLHVERR